MSSSRVVRLVLLLVVAWADRWTDLFCCNASCPGAEGTTQQKNGDWQPVYTDPPSRDGVPAGRHVVKGSSSAVLEGSDTSNNHT